MTTTEIAPDLFRISIYVQEFNLQFNQFLIRDEQPMLYHTGMRRMFPQLCEGVARLMDPKRLRWIGFSHFEADECGALNEWLGLAPQSQAVCSAVGAMVNIADFAVRPGHGLQRDEVLATGKYRFRFRPTPHLPHGWDAGVLFEETHRTLLCSDLFHQDGNLEPVSKLDILDQVRQTLTAYQKGPLMDYMPYSTKTKGLLHGLAELQPKTLATMHGSAFVGDGARALRELDLVMKEVLGTEVAAG